MSNGRLIINPTRLPKKFPECKVCIFLPKNSFRVEAPVCRECTNGEFFEEKVFEMRPENWRLQSRQYDAKKPREDEDNVTDE